MNFAKAHIPERAAIPRHVKIIPSLPLTGVGKIFKRDLQQREIEATIRGEAAKVGASIGELWFERDPRLGPVVRVRTSAGAALLRAALERYAFKFGCWTSVVVRELTGR